MKRGSGKSLLVAMLCVVTYNIYSSHAERWDENYKIARLSEASIKEIPLKNL